MLEVASCEQGLSSDRQNTVVGLRANTFALCYFAPSSTTCQNKMQSVNSSQVRFDPRRKALVNDGRCIKGLTALLKQTFYPRYVYTRPKHLPDLAIQSHCKRIKGSRRVGTGFDSKITETVKLQLKYKLDPQCFWSEASAKQQLSKVTSATHRSAILAG